MHQHLVSFYISSKSASASASGRFHRLSTKCIGIWVSFYIQLKNQQVHQHLSQLLHRLPEVSKCIGIWSASTSSTKESASASASESASTSAAEVCISVYIWDSFYQLKGILHQRLHLSQLLSAQESQVHQHLSRFYISSGECISVWDHSISRPIGFSVCESVSTSQSASTSESVSASQSAQHPVSTSQSASASESSINKPISVIEHISFWISISINLGEWHHWAHRLTSLSTSVSQSTLTLASNYRKWNTYPLSKVK